MSEMSKEFGRHIYWQPTLPALSVSQGKRILLQNFNFIQIMTSNMYIASVKKEIV